MKAAVPRVDPRIAMNRRLVSALCLVCFSAAFSSLAAAQSTGTGTVTGLVTDAQGKAITGAAVV